MAATNHTTTALDRAAGARSLDPLSEAEMERVVEALLERGSARMRRQPWR